MAKALKLQFDISCPDCKEVYNLSGRAHCIGFRHRLENRCVLRHISNVNFQSWELFWAVGAAERKKTFKLPYKNTFEASFFMFHGQKH